MQLTYLLPTVFIAILCSAACVSPIDTKPRIDLWGDPASISAATRTIVITPATKYVNVTGGEIIRFVKGNKVFAWNFNSAQEIPPFDLNLIAPADTIDHSVMVYTEPNPLYIRNRGPWWSPWAW